MVTRREILVSFGTVIATTRLRSQYNIGYTPAESAAARKGEYRKIRIDTTRKNEHLIIQARSGYFADK